MSSIMINVETLLAKMYDEDAGNHFDDLSLGKMFDSPLVCVADAHDPWFDRFKEIIGGFYWTPQEALDLVASGNKAQSVISWCLPISQAARKDNAGEKLIPARTWAYVRTFGEKMVTRLRHGMENQLREMGYAAVAPAVVPENRVQEHASVGISSCWSERHTAMVAGLGTFGISGGLITSRGVAHRLGSVVTNARIEPTPRPYADDPFAWCLRTACGTCRACIRRCPAGSIGETIQERDKTACRKHLSSVRELGKERYNWDGTLGCGLCQTAVPCESRNPTAKE